MGCIYKRDSRSGAGEQRWTIEWKDHLGRTRRRRVYGEKAVARAMLAKEEARVARGEAGLLDPFEKTKTTKLQALADSYAKSLAGEKRAPRYVSGIRDRLALAIEVMGVRFLQEITPDRVDTFLARLMAGDNLPPMKPRRKGGRPIPRGPVSAVTRDRYGEALRSFGAWLHYTERWPLNPFGKVRRIAGDADRTMEHRAWTPEEIGQLIEAATTRCVQQWVTAHPSAPAEKIDALREEGWRRSVLYEFAAYAGLRLSECTTLTWSQIVLDGDEPSVTVQAALAKNRKRGQSVPLVPWVVAGLKELRERQKAAAVRAGRPMVSQSDRVFALNRGLLEALRKDATWAFGKERGLYDAQGRRTTFHGFRASTCTMLHRAGVTLAVAVKIMRHADPKLTIETYAKLDSLTDGHRELAKMALPRVTAVPTELPGVLAGVEERPKLAVGGRVDFAASAPIPAQVVPAAGDRPSLAASGRVGENGRNGGRCRSRIRNCDPATVGEQRVSGFGSSPGSPGGSSSPGELLARLSAAARAVLVQVQHGVLRLPPDLVEDLQQLLQRGGVQ
jgi:integrase